MSSRLFVPNFGFEDELAGRRMSRTARAATMGLCGVWTPLLEASDQIVSWGIEGDSETSEQRQEFSFGQGRRVEIVPWGWSVSVAKLAKTTGSTQQIPELGVVERINRRSWAFKRESQMGMCPVGTTIIESIAELRALVAKGRDGGGGWVVKSDLGAAGRGQRRIRETTVDGVVLEWVAEMLKRDGLVIIEPWLDSIGEFGLQFEIGPGAKVRHCGVTELLVTESGGYRGSRIGTRPQGMSPKALESLLAMVEPLVAEIGRCGYFGPLGIDSMRYRLPTGETAWRPLQDVNARHTMGRCALEWESHIPHDVGASVLIVRWADPKSVDQQLANAELKIGGLARAKRFSPQTSPPDTVSGLVLLVYDQCAENEAIEGRVVADLERPNQASSAGGGVMLRS